MPPQSLVQNIFSDIIQQPGKFAAFFVHLRHEMEGRGENFFVAFAAHGDGSVTTFADAHSAANAASRVHDCAVEQGEIRAGWWEGRIAKAQSLAQRNGKNPQLWADVQDFLSPAGAKPSKVKETQQYVLLVSGYELEFARKSTTKDMKQKEKRESKTWCTEGHWVTIDDRPVFICDRKPV